jgi:hypothetical protein
MFHLRLLSKIVNGKFRPSLLQSVGHLALSVTPFPFIHSFIVFQPSNMKLIILDNRTLVQAFPQAGLGVSVATGGCIFQSEVFAASTPVIESPSSSSNLQRQVGQKEHRWGKRGVLVLVPLRPGLDRVHPIYYDTIKV